jgi:UDP:flavonoid glycosyltransferase YjiC (YdhE family)
LNALYGVSSVGLGHAKRSLLIARELRRSAGVHVDWVCAEPPKSYLESKGEKVLGVSSRLISLSGVFETLSVGGRVSSTTSLILASNRAAHRNFTELRGLLQAHYDVILQDEFAETLFMHRWSRRLELQGKRVLFTDYVYFEEPSMNPLKKLFVWYANRELRRAFSKQDLRFYLEWTHDLPPELRSRIEENFIVVGPIVERPPIINKRLVRVELGLEGDEEFVLFTIGGTAIGAELLRVAASAAGKIKKETGLSTVILAGPRVSIPVSREVKWVGFTPDPLRYFAASSCVVTQAGGSTLHEVSMLGVPAVVVPIGNHWEQIGNSRRFSRKYGFPVLSYSQIGEATLIDAIRDALRLHYEPEEKPGVEKEVVKIIRENFSI